MLKRKHDSNYGTAQPNSSGSKMPKKVKTVHASRIDNLKDIDEDHNINNAMSQMDGALMADFITRQTKRFEQDLSLVELEDRRIPVHALEDSSGWKDHRTLEALPSFLEYHTKRGRQEIAEANAEIEGAPSILVIASAGLRAADLTRTLRVYQTRSAPVAKLFAKHIKLKDAVNFLTHTKFNIGVGTPQRLLDLLQAGALRLDVLTHIVIDGSYVDSKRRGIFDMKETLSPMTQLLSCPQLKQRYESIDHAVKVLVF